MKIAYGAGEIANAIKVVTFALYALFFATIVVGLPGIWVGVVAFLSTLWDAFLDPIVGYLTDGRHSFPRRYKCMVAGGCTIGLGLWAFFSPPHHLSVVTLFAWLLVASFGLRTAASVFTIPYYAIGVQLTQDYGDRTSITGIRNIGTAIGTLLAASLSVVMFFPDKTPGIDPKLNSGAYSAMGLTFGGFMTVSALIAVWATWALRSHLEESGISPPHTPRQSPSEFFRSMRQCLRSHSFQVILISFSFVIVGLAVNGSLLIHYLKYYVEVDRSSALGISQAVYCSAGLLGTLFWLRIADRFDKHILYIFSAAATAFILCSAQWAFGKGRPLGTGNAQPLFMFYALAGFFGCMLWFLPPSMMADVADESQLATGSRPEGALFGVLSFFKQIATGVAVLLAGGLLEKYVKLVPGEARQSADVAYRIGIAYSVVPAVFLLASAALMFRYRLTRSRVETIQAELADLKGADL